MLTCSQRLLYYFTTLLPGGGVLYVAVEQLGVLKYDVFTGAALGTVPCNDCIGLTYDK